MRFTKKFLAVLVPVFLIGTMTFGIAAATAPTDRPDASWRMAGDWAPIGGQTSAVANTMVNVRSSPTMRPNGWAAGPNNNNVIGRLVSGQAVSIHSPPAGYEIVRAWTYTDVSRRSDIGYTGPSRWIHIETADGLIGWVYIAFLNFN